MHAYYERVRSHPDKSGQDLTQHGVPTYTLV
jgi:hypothetical protein